jgi:agmatine/peptidylarginine deiminase
VKPALCPDSELETHFWHTWVRGPDTGPPFLWNPTMEFPEANFIFNAYTGMTYDRIKRSFLVLEVVVMNIMSMIEILVRILGGTIVSISILDIIFSTDFHFSYQ